MMQMFEDKLCNLLNDRGETFHSAELDTGIACRGYYGKRCGTHKRTRHILMAWAYYLGMTVEDLVEDTDLEAYWAGDTDRRTPM